MNKLLCLLIALTCSQAIYAQFSFEYQPDGVPVNVTGNTLSNPYGGGFNYVQVSDLDYDYDGDMDLVVFDRTSDNIRLFENVLDGTTRHYRQVYNASQLFPEDLRYRVFLTDYDQDGENDLFTYGIGGIKVYKNTGDAANGLQWQLFKTLLKSDYSGTYTNLYVSSSDIPAIVDVDYDGDLDVLTFGISGQHLEYHQNQSMELYGIPDSLEFVLVNQCWGKFGEDLNNNTILLNDNSAPCTSGNVPNPQRVTGPSGEQSDPNAELNRHAGSTVLALDYDGNGVKDLVLGDVSFPNMTLLINGGTAPNTNSPMVSQDNAFPSNTVPVHMQLFPAAFYTDINFDGVRDLIVSGNAKNISQNEKSIYSYINNGADDQPQFVFGSKAFLQQDMLDHGTGTLPVIADLNGDGLKDLLIGNLFRYKETLDKESTLAYYQNTGTATAPVFTYVDNDFLNLSAQSYGLRSAPACADIDNDGDQDLFLGLEDGTIVYYENITTGSTPVFAAPVANYTDNTGSTISAGQFCAPQLFDLDKDGKTDLILGTKTGHLIYYRNTGTAGAPVFTLMNSTLGNVDVSQQNTPDGYATPHFFEHNDTTVLFLGAYDGKLHFYTDITDNLDAGSSFSLYSSDFLKVDIQGYSSFFVDDIDNDGFLNMFAGQDLGGLYHFEVDPNSTASLNTLSEEKFACRVYPNPTSGTIHIEIQESGSYSLELSDMQGRILESRSFSGHADLNLADQQQGVYFIRMTDKQGNTVVRKVVRR